jgi:hypothetical protein
LVSAFAAARRSGASIASHRTSSARLPDGSVRHTTNHFTLDDGGKVVRLSVYMKVVS